ncbi:MAG TPA: hypothetical protein DET40_14640 [Lentisphaeria bacterium]|nr:MAG: hypothetical protein A2X45_05810 [Lentisphaerae bacterium GWF2_50_93]HCE44776.1 hypothetical protein [Lentisphaeria bacterium]
MAMVLVKAPVVGVIAIGVTLALWKLINKIYSGYLNSHYTQEYLTMIFFLIASLVTAFMTVMASFNFLGKGPYVVHNSLFDDLATNHFYLLLLTTFILAETSMILSVCSIMKKKLVVLSYISLFTVLIANSFNALFVPIILFIVPYT